jgi:tetratricopeptide (TPR) repeat protein
VMALFGAPVAHEDDPERAVRAALAIRDETELDVRIGITTGEALVALGVRPESGEGMASGDVVNTASRLQGAAPENGVLVDESTYRATRRAIEYRESEAVRAKGKAEPIAVWEALEARSRFGVDLEQRVGTPLVGRDAEARLLGEALARARREREPQLVTIVGVPGIGKSRLVAELFQAVDADPDLIAWRQGRSLPYGEGVSYWALAEMVKAQAGILETDSPEEVARKLAAAAQDLGGDRADWVEQHLRPLVGLSGTAGEDRRAEAFAAWRAFLEGLAELQPTVLVFEDLQWADDGLLDFVDHLVDWARGVPLLVVCTSRPELLARRPGWGGGKPNASTLSLSPLSEEDTARLVHELLERAVLPAELQTTLLQRAGGNPLYAEEFSRMVAERASLPEGELPETVQGIIAARIDGLDADSKALLQDAAVLGKVFWTGALAALGDSDRFAVEELLHGLERREFVRRERRSSVGDESEYAFRHLLVRDVAYGQIPRARRAEKHHLAAQWLEGLGRPEDQAEMLAHHYLRALEFARAAEQDVTPLVAGARPALIEAGDRARSLEAFPAALSYYRAALELTDQPEPELLLDMAQALYFVESVVDEGPVLEARDGLLAKGEVERAAEAEVLLARFAWRRGEAERSQAAYERAIALVSERDASRVKADVLLTAARGAMVGARHDHAIRLGGEALTIAEALALHDLRAGALITIGTSRAAQGEDAGLEDFRRGLDLAVAQGSGTAIQGYIGLADRLIDTGDLEGGLEARAEARRISERLGVGIGLDWVRGERPGELYTLGRWDEALQLAEEFITFSCSSGGHYLEGTCRQVRGGILLARGDLERALDDADRALEQGRSAKDPQALYPALAFAARVRFVGGRADDAGALLDELLDGVRATRDAPIGYAWLRSAALTARSLSRDDEVIEALAALPRTPWVDAAIQIAAGDFAAAAQRYAEMGAKPDEAYSRLAAAEELVAQGRRGAAESELRKALAFLRSVDASVLVRRGEQLLAASA